MTVQEYLNLHAEPVMDSVAMEIRLAFEAGRDQHPDAKELERLRAAIRAHRDARGHDRCWENDLELYRALGEPLPDHPGMPSHGEFIMKCEEYFAGQCRLRKEGQP